MESLPSRCDWTRREFLTLPLLAGAAACTRQYDRSAFRRPDRSAVALLPAGDYAADLADLISRGLRTLGVDVRGRRVLLKPNLVEYEKGSCINTNPAVVAGAVIAMARAGAASVAVGEGPGHRRDLEYLLVSSGLFDALKELRVPFLDLNHDEVKAVRLKSRFMGVESLMVPQSVLSADLLVSVAKLKTHHWAGMTGAMKNLFGIVPGAIYGWPKNFLHFRGVSQSIVDLNATVHTGLAIVDGIVGMEGDGPIMGTPRPVGFVAMGTDVVAVDATCARVIGLEPTRLDYLQVASQFLGNVDARRIDQRGEAMARFATRFAVVERNRGLLAAERSR